MIILAMFVSLVLMLGLWLNTSYRDAVRRAEERTIAASKIVASNVSLLDSLARQALQRIDETLGENIVPPASAKVRNIDEAVADLPGQVNAYVVDEAGLTLYSTDPMIKPISIVDRPYFSELAKGANQHISSLLISRLNGEQIFAFSRRLERNGLFAGAAVVSFEVKVLADVWEAVDLGPNSTVSFARADGQLVARYPLADGPLDMSQYVLFTDYLPKSATGTYEAVSPVDDAHRVVAYRTVDDTGLIALASADYDFGIQRFWRDVTVAISVLVLAGVSLLAAGQWIRHLRQRDAAQSQLLRNALADNQLLLREIHHRVKNNLQAVQSIIQLQRLPVETQQSLSDRISSMVAVHEQIYRHDEFSFLCAQDLIRSVVEKLLNAYGSAVTVDYDIDEIAISTDNATPLALLVSELLTNILKYAFTDGRVGTFSIALKSIGERRARLTVHDNGVGFDPQTIQRGMGSRLIQGVVNQLNGTHTFDGSDGTTFTAELEIVEPRVSDQSA
ncbi:sensor histidine kinase [Shinella curvata]|uniref:histidine kinase n=1 Tax=Shinella curvata TaxID=1817964 RepID=A0ABT8XNX8_9HYPH|nr:histidine kinase dimerization/phosphoacceptor domain -containing protein [Shinella curvata]MCJ8056164.1 sensor histidine kinase [Shinella curvata]MDO6125133.1 sensor histidine kinase [Shinella curvata]